MKNQYLALNLFYFYVILELVDAATTTGVFKYYGCAAGQTRLDNEVANILLRGGQMHRRYGANRPSP